MADGGRLELPLAKHGRGDGGGLPDLRHWVVVGVSAGCTAGSCWLVAAASAVADCPP
jgi:hypothetical protein